MSTARLARHLSGLATARGFFPIWWRGSTTFLTRAFLGTVHYCQLDRTPPRPGQMLAHWPPCRTAPQRARHRLPESALP